MRNRTFTRRLIDLLRGSPCSDCVNRLNDLALFARGHDDVNCGEHSFPICVFPVRSLCK